MKKIKNSTIIQIVTHTNIINFQNDKEINKLPIKKEKWFTKLFRYLNSKLIVEIITILAALSKWLNLKG